LPLAEHGPEFKEFSDEFTLLIDETGMWGRLAMFEVADTVPAAADTIDAPPLTSWYR
jgi:hypothetical protein